jgi:glutathione S-transferase
VELRCGARRRIIVRMKFYSSIGPNPHIARMFMAERGIELPTVKISVRKMENRQAPYLSINPAGQVPALELDDGSVITEVVAICEYLDEITPGPKLMGETPEARAQVRRWSRWVDLNVSENLYDGYRFGEGLEEFKMRARCIPEASAGLKARVQDKLEWLDQQIEERPFIAGANFSLADIMLYCALNFGNFVGQPLRPELRNVHSWFERIAARPSASA